MENPLYLIFAIVFGLAFITVLIYVFSHRNGNVQTQNNGGNQPPANNGGNNQQPVGNLCDGPLPLRATVHIEAQDLPINLWLGLCNPRQFVRILLSILAAILLILTLVFVYLAVKPDDTAKPVATQQIQNPPAGQQQPPIINPPVQTLDPKTIIDPVNGKIDQSTLLLAGKIDSVNKNLTAHRQSSKRGYKVQNEKLDKIAAGVNDNGIKLDGIKQQISDLNASLTALRGELNTKVNELKTALSNNSGEEIKSLTTAVNDLRIKIEVLEKQKQQLQGDPD